MNEFGQIGGAIVQQAFWPASAQLTHRSNSVSLLHATDDIVEMQIVQEFVGPDPTNADIKKTFSSVGMYNVAIDPCSYTSRKAGPSSSIHVQKHRKHR